MKCNNFISVLSIFMILAVFDACKEKSGKQTGVIVMNEKEAFGEVIELEGKKVLTNSMMDPRVRSMLLKDDKLICQYENDPPFVIINVPSMEVTGHKGRRGQGPNEFIYPQLVPTSNPDLLSYILENTNKKVYTLDNHYQILPYPFDISAVLKDRIYSAQLFNIKKEDFMCVSQATDGIGIFRITKEKDSIQRKELHNLNLRSRLSSFVPYLGSFTLNADKKRMVYAYRYYKIIKFMNFDVQTIKTLDFKQVEFDESTLGVADGLDMNVAHYSSICAQPDHVYIGYLGQKPTEYDQGKGFFIEQYDWYGKPVRKYKLDRDGLFAVDEKSGLLYLLCRQEDDPFYVYTLPK